MLCYNNDNGINAMQQQHPLYRGFFYYNDTSRSDVATNVTTTTTHDSPTLYHSVNQAQQQGTTPMKGPKQNIVYTLGNLFVKKMLAS